MRAAGTGYVAYTPRAGGGAYASAAGHALAGFEDAADAAVRLLRRGVGLDLWLVTRIAGADQVVVAADPPDVVSPFTAVTWANA